MKPFRLSLLAATCLVAAAATRADLVADLNVQQTIRLGSTSTGTISPAQITSTQNNYAPTGYAAAFRYRINSDAARDITGLAGGTAGLVKVLTNIGATHTITLKDASGSSTDVNRFDIGADFPLAPKGSVMIEYDGTSQRWRLHGISPSAITALYQPLDTDLTAIAGISSTGLIARTGSGTAAARTITGTANEITVTNGDGSSGNPTISLPASMTLTGKTITGGTFAGSAFNGTVGATTPAAGTFTSVTSSGNVVVNGGNDLQLFNGSGNANAQLYNPGGSGVYSLAVRLNGADRALFTTTGLNNAVIGATTPAAGAFTTLSASSSISATGGGLIFVSSGSTTGSIYARLSNTGGNLYWGKESSTGSAIASGTSAYAAVFGNESNYPVQIVSNNAIVGSFSPTGLAVTGRVIANGGTGASASQFDASFDGAALNGLDLRDSSDSSGAFFGVFRKASGGAIGSINRVTTTDAVAYNTTSDGRLKTNVRAFTAEDSGPIIDGLRPVWFDWKASDLNETVDVPVSSAEVDGQFLKLKSETGEVIGSVRRVVTEEGVDYGQDQSDIRWKDGNPISVRMLRPVLDVARISKHEADNKSIIGFIAQEEAVVDPALVRSGAVTPGDDDPEKITKQWQRSDSALVPILVAEVKALRARVAALEESAKPRK